MAALLAVTFFPYQANAVPHQRWTIRNFADPLFKNREFCDVDDNIAMRRPSVTV